MRDTGLSEAIQAAGGVSELARRIGISQPSVSNWDKVPAERVLLVEASTGINRKVLRPDLYDEKAPAPPVDEIDLARAREYALLSALLVRAPDAALLKKLASLRADATPLGVAHVGLAEAAAAVSVQSVEREYFDLFIGLARGELLPYGSFYIAGFLHERPLARLRGDLARFNIERVEGNYEPEDHAATLCEIMAGFASGGGQRPAHLRKASCALDRPLLRRSGASAGGEFLPSCGDARPRVHGNRTRSVRFAVVSREPRNNEPKEGLR